MFLTRTSCREITHADGYCGVWPGWAVSGSAVLLTEVYEKVYTCSDGLNNADGSSRVPSHPLPLSLHVCLHHGVKDRG